MRKLTRAFAVHIDSLDADKHLYKNDRPRTPLRDQMSTKT